MKFKLIPRKNPQKAADPPKYYAQVVRPENITIEKLSKRISEISPVNELDTESVLIAFTRVLPEFFIQGATVQLGDLGYFQTSLHSEGADSPEDFKLSMIKGFSVRYRASSKVKQEYQRVKYIKAKE